MTFAAIGIVAIVAISVRFLIRQSAGMAADVQQSRP